MAAHFPTTPGSLFNIKMSSYQYRQSHCGDKTILRPSYLHNGTSYTGKILSLYWIRAQHLHPWYCCGTPGTFRPKYQLIKNPQPHSKPHFLISLYILCRCNWFSSSSSCTVINPKLLTYLLTSSSSCRKDAQLRRALFSIIQLFDHYDIKWSKYHLISGN